MVEVDLREQILDVTGQEIMTADKVTLRMTAVVTYRVVDARQSVVVADGAQQSLYREAQLALRAIVAARWISHRSSDGSGYRWRESHVHP